MKTIKILLSISILITLFSSCKKDDDPKEEQLDPNAIVNIPDANFKYNLLHYDDPVIDENADGEIQAGEARKITDLNLSNCGISDLTGLEVFSNLTTLNLSSNSGLTSIDISKNTKIEKLKLDFNLMASIDVSKNSKLNDFSCYHCTKLSSVKYPSDGGVIENLNYCQTDFNPLDTSKLTQLKFIGCRAMKVTQFDFSANHNLKQVWADNNQNLTKVNVKTGNIALLGTLEVFDCPNLTTICVDDVAAANAKDPTKWKKDTTAHYSSTCN